LTRINAALQVGGKLKSTALDMWMDNLSHSLESNPLVADEAEAEAVVG